MTALPRLEDGVHLERGGGHREGAVGRRGEGLGDSRGGGARATLALVDGDAPGAGRHGVRAAEPPGHRDGFAGQHPRGADRDRDAAATIVARLVPFGAGVSARLRFGLAAGVASGPFFDSHSPLFGPGRLRRSARAG